MIVLDATLVVKLVTRETGSDAALARIAHEPHRLAPNWVKIEVAHALANKVEHNGLPQDVANAALNQVDTFLTETADGIELLEDAFALAAKLGHAVYDCLYLALAMRHQAVVVTHDVKFVRAATRGGFAANVELLT